MLLGSFERFREFYLHEHHNFVLLCQLFDLLQVCRKVTALYQELTVMTNQLTRDAFD